MSGAESVLVPLRRFPFLVIISKRLSAMMKSMGAVQNPIPALRFHFGEITLSVVFRAAQVFVIGPSPLDFAAWQVFVFICILFHHSNVRLPLIWERRLARIIMTPRLHGIHHSIAPEEVNSNWSSGFTVWDWLHGTLRTEVPQDRIVIGVAGYRDDVRNALVLPFRDGGNVAPMTYESIRQPLSALEE